MIYIQPEISVIVPVYKVEPYLHRCIDSILAQTFTDFELILVDDGSPDKCGAICDEYAAKDSRIKVIHKENGGVSSARNAGLDITSGRYIMFCDSDDYVTADWCGVLYEQIHMTSHALIVSDILRVPNGDKRPPATESPTASEPLTYFELYKLGISAYLVNKIFDADIIHRHNIRLDEACSFSEDVEFVSKYCSHLSCEVIHICKPLYYYCDNENSLMNRYYENGFSLHLLPFRCRLPLVGNSLQEYCDIWLYHFITLFENIFDKRCTLSFLQKLRYNHRMMNTEEFKYCLANCSGATESALTLRILRTHNYYLFWLFQRLVHLKQSLLKH